MSLRHLALALLATLGFATSLSALAREGTPMGHGVKCYYVTVQNPDGSFTHTQICRKGP